MLKQTLGELSCYYDPRDSGMSSRMTQTAEEIQQKVRLSLVVKILSIYNVEDIQTMQQHIDNCQSLIDQANESQRKLQLAMRKLERAAAQLL